LGYKDYTWGGNYPKNIKNISKKEKLLLRNWDTNIIQGVEMFQSKKGKFTIEKLK